MLGWKLNASFRKGSQSLWMREGMIRALERRWLSSSSNQAEATQSCHNSNKDDEPASGRQRRRRRHNFDVTSVPSFQEFQQQQQVRQLYRKFWRVTSPLAPANRDELRQQVRHEFRRNLQVSSSWDRKRALSEGSRRLKEISAMLGSSVKSATNEEAESSLDEDDEDRSRSAAARKTSETKQWPWQRNKTEKSLQTPPRLPKKAV